jgi:hypothetical protein
MSVLVTACLAAMGAMMRPAVAALAVFALVGASCSGGESVHSALYDPAHPLPPKAADAPLPLITGPAPECPYDPVGTVTVEGRRRLPSRETTLALTREARRMGGDAIIALSSSRTGLAGTVIRFRDTSCTR